VLSVNICAAARAIPPRPVNETGLLALFVEHAKFLCEIDFVHRLLLIRTNPALAVYVTMAAILIVNYVKSI
jgi:hypothetical protein